MDSRDLDDYGIDPDGPDDPLPGEEMDPALSALLKGLPGINAEEMEEMLKDLPLPQMVLDHAQRVEYQSKRQLR